ncbi:MAG: matrixin family metalloprotease [Actinomycetota bacterium]
MEKHHERTGSPEPIPLRPFPSAALVLAAALAFGAPTAPQAPDRPPVVAHRDATVAPSFVHTAASSARGSSSRLSAAMPSACSDGAYAVYSSKWTKQYNFYVKTSTTPSGVSSDSAVSAIREAVRNITRGDNDCGISANIGATAAYQGSTSSSANITTSAGCGSRDGRNVVDFGTLPVGYLALTCWWSSGGTIIEADLRMNKASYGWVTSLAGCSSKWSIQGVTTHEFGHAFGMDHVSESSHGNLTMSPTIFACQNSESSLGLGDVRGLENKY